MRARFVVVWSVVLAAALIPGGVAADPPEKLLKDRAEIALKIYKSQWMHFVGGHAKVETLYQWSRRVLKAQQALAPNKAARMTTLKNHLDRMSELRRVAEMFAKTGNLANHDADAAQFFLLEAEIWIAQEKAKK